MDMTKDALQYLHEGRRKPEDSLFRPAWLPDTHFAQMMQSGGIEIQGMPGAPRSHCLDSLTAFCDAVNAYGDEKTHVFVGQPGQSRQATIKAVLDNSDGSGRWHTLCYRPGVSHQYSTMLEMEHQQFSHQEFLKLLRVDLHGCGLGQIERTFRSLKFRKTEGADRTVDIGKQSMGLDVEQSLVRKTGDGDSPIPEEIEAHVHLYDDVLDTDGEVLPYKVRLSVDVDVVEGTFRIRPYPGELERVVRDTTQWIIDEIARGMTVCDDSSPGKPIFAGSA